MCVGLHWEVSRTIVSKVILVQYSAGTLTGYICYPYASNAEAMLVGETEDSVPHWLIDFLCEVGSCQRTSSDWMQVRYLGHSTTASGDDGDIAFLRR